MKIMKLKKIVVACQTAAMTMVTSVAVSTQASDVELYKAPQTSQTTIMFMMDVSGSMDYTDTGVTGTRMERLKEGMRILLQGDLSKGITPLPDNLVSGLSEFSGSNGTGRIKLEAKALGDTQDLGTKEIYRVETPTTYTGTRVQTETKTRIQTRTIKRTRSSSWANWPAWPNWGSYSSWGNWSNSWGNTSSSGETITNKVRGTPGVIQECIEWNSPNNINDPSCKTWMDSVKTLVDIEGLSSVGSEYPSNWGAWDNSSWTNSTPTNTISNNIVLNECSATTGWFPSYCSEQTQSQTNTETQYRSRTQTGTANGKLVTIYTGSAKETHRKRMLRAVNELYPNGGTPTSFAYAEVGAYLLGTTTKGQNYSGFSSSNNIAAIQNGTNYIAPTSINKDKQCNTQGIYFLTDGEPQGGVAPQSFYRATLASKSGTFSCNGTTWDCIHKYATTLLDPAKNPAGVSIKTAVVGFGNDFDPEATNKTTNVINAIAWGNDYGKGGTYSAKDANGVVSSVLAFLKKLQKYIPPVTTGSVTIPVDNLDTQNIQPWGYFPQFDPAPNAKVTTWVGNLKKYQVVDNVLKDQDNANVMITSGTKKGESVDNPNDYWADQSITKVITKIETVNNVDKEVDYTVRVGGALSRLLLGSATTTGTNPVTLERAIFTDRKISLANDNATYVANPIENGDLLKISTTDLKNNNATNNFSYDSKRGYLAALFGYDVTKAMASGLTQASNTAFNNFLIQSNATLRQMGAVMHSKPILITQKGTTKYDEKTETISYDDRDDLIAFGTTQGLLHVVRAGKSATDSDAGKEVFVFVPNEMIENQSAGFLTQESQDPALQYGIDGQWTAYTEYATKAGTKTNEPVVSVASANGGKQWLYGGLRMGGKSYYSLDLSDMTSAGGTPKLKFRINPTGTCSASNGLGCMGQSWSKPSIAWVNWQGKRKLVMFVGGGYDTNYENSADYLPSSSYIDQGAGVYMFDANDGSLLWWTSANAGSSNTAANKTYAADMKRSVVSSIKTVDRNSDGLVDHLYFGDLGGQVWRVDLNASTKAGVATDGENFATRVVRILDMSGETKPPRFYNTPAFTIHSVPSGGLFAAISIGSGNVSYPMSATTNDADAVYVVYDKDVTRRNLPVLSESELYTHDIKPGGATGKKLVKNTTGTVETALSNGGWYYPLGTQKRILNDSVAIDSDLYVSIFDSSKDIEDVDCYGGVRGESNSKLFCLPYGDAACKPVSSGSGSGSGDDEIFLGKGNVGISFGGINRDRGMVLNLATDKTLRKYKGKTKFISQRWYER